MVATSAQVTLAVVGFAGVTGINAVATGGLTPSWAVAVGLSGAAILAVGMFSPSLALAFAILAIPGSVLTKSNNWLPGLTHFVGGPSPKPKN